MAAPNDAALGKKTALAAILTGLLASLCCIGPLAVALLGIGGAGAGLFAVFDSLRPYLIAFTVLLLGAGFYVVYFRKPKLAGAAGAADACGCEKPKQQRFGKTMLWVATLVALSSFASPYILSAWANSGPPPIVSKEKNIERVTLKVSGMTCGGCASNVKLALKKVAGVKNAHVTYQPPHAVVDFDSSKTTTSQLIAAIVKAGYKASLLASQQK